MDAEDAGPLRPAHVGSVALVCALIALGGLALTPWLAYLPVVAALPLLTLVVWLGTIDAFVRAPLAIRVVATLVAATASTAWGWLTAPGWFLLPALWALVAALSTRSISWAVTACVAAFFATMSWA